MTPKEAFRKFQEGAAGETRSWSTGSMRRQPQFTPTSGAIAEENEDGASDGGAKKSKSATEMIARGLAAAEVEKRKLEDKLTEQKSSKLWIKRTLWPICSS